MKKLALAVLAALLSAHTCFADDHSTYFVDGNKLYERCMENGIWCIAYIEGVLGAMDARRILHGSSSCVRPNVAAGQVRDVVARFLAAHPENRDAPAALLAMTAIRETFCPGDST